MPHAGGPGKAFGVNVAPHVDESSVESVNDTWRAIDACGPPTSATAGDVTTQTAGRPDGRTVKLISVAGAGHQWPGGARTPLAELAGEPEPSTALDATDTIWRFVDAHRGQPGQHNL